MCYKHKRRQFFAQFLLRHTVFKKIGSLQRYTSKINWPCAASSPLVLTVLYTDLFWTQNGATAVDDF